MEVTTSQAGSGWHSPAAAATPVVAGSVGSILPRARAAAPALAKTELLTLKIKQYIFLGIALKKHFIRAREPSTAL